MSTPKILVTGAGGQVARCLADLKEKIPAEWIFVSRSELDIADSGKVAEYFNRHHFDFCVNTAAYTKVDLAETEPTQANIINAEAVDNLAGVCARGNCTLVHFSTDYIYDNGLHRPLGENDPVNPKSVYASSKLAGEERALEANPKTIILRTSWVFSEYGHNFVRTMVRLMREGRPLRIVNDQTGCPTYAGDLARAIIDIIKYLQTFSGENVYGIYNYCNAGETTWFDFARTMSNLIGADASLTPVSTAEYGAVARRPAYSVLDTTKIKRVFGVERPPWEESLGLVLKRLENES